MRKLPNRMKRAWNRQWRTSSSISNFYRTSVFPLLFSLKKSITSPLQESSNPMLRQVQGGSHSLHAVEEDFIPTGQLIQILFGKEDDDNKLQNPSPSLTQNVNINNPPHTGEKIETQWSSRELIKNGKWPMVDSDGWIDQAKKQKAESNAPNEAASIKKISTVVVDSGQPRRAPWLH